ncbi:TM2 domain-containing protein [Phaeodactylibacter luteus]|uniref:TM2 domain-containing protein n=1 Tax=Phaeodactylibacter luteus TaxID=1564516 RepID=UPI001B87520A
MNADAFANLTVEEFLALTPRDIRQQTGERLSLKETIALKAAQKKIKKELRKVDESAPKSQLIALLLVILVGGIGIHRFYLGYTTIGIIQLLTLGGCGVWALIDLIRIITGDLGPADGSAYDPKL